MKTSIGLGGLVGFCVVTGFGGCSVLETDGIDSWTPTVSTSSSSSGAGGAGGAGMGGSGKGGGGAAAPTCNHNGMLEDNEECDDGDMDSGDGCYECKLEACYAWDMNANKVAPLAAGTSCGPNQFCNDGGQCGSHCIDTVINEGETGTDCGGMDCKKCVKESCNKHDECANGNCFDGICCMSPCSTVCKSCNLAGLEGQCKDIFAGLEDTEPAMACVGPGKACDGNTNCLDKKKNGETCNGGKSECASDTCSPVLGMATDQKYCGIAQGDACTVNEQCAVGVCTGGICGLPKDAVCTSQHQCASGTCSTGQCT